MNLTTLIQLFTHLAPIIMPILEKNPQVLVDILKVLPQILTALNGGTVSPSSHDPKLDGPNFKWPLQ